MLTYAELAQVAAGVEAVMVECVGGYVRVERQRKEEEEARRRVAGLGRELVALEVERDIRLRGLQVPSLLALLVHTYKC